MTDIREVEAMLAAIPVSSCSYQEWIDVGMALHREGLPVGVWDDWSRGDSRYHAGECKRKWATFGKGSSVVTLGTVHKMATDRGWKPNAGGPRENPWGISFDVPITKDTPIDYADHTPAVAAEPSDGWNPSEQISAYLRSLFRPDDHVAYVTEARQDKDGKWKPAVKGVCSFTRDELLHLVKKDPTLGALGTSNPEAGAWVCINPVDGQGRNNVNVTAYRHALVESDTQSIDEQMRIYKAMRLPIKVIVHSGGKSLHAIVKVDAADADEYAKRVRFLHQKCAEYGLNVDLQNKNPSRLSRLPGYERGNRKQYIVAQDVGCDSWDEWETFIESESVTPYPVINMRSAFLDKPPLKPELIHGMLRQGHKMVLVSSSKAGKTFALIELSISIAEGGLWCGQACEQGPVLYLNMEIDPASFIDRVHTVYQKMDIAKAHPEMIDVINLRGRVEGLDTMIERVICTAKARNYSAIFIDPIYKLGIGDENKANEVGAFCNAMDRIAAETGASMIYSHHHSKGAQGAKAAMDRASGSGVFARDPDAIVDLIELAIPELYREKIIAKYGPEATAWRMEPTLREFSRMKPVNLFFSWPRHYVDTDGWLDGTNLEESERLLKDGREKGTAARKRESENKMNQYHETYLMDQEMGLKRTQAEYGEMFKVSTKTIQRYNEALGI